MPPLLRCRHSQHTWFLPSSVICGSCAGIDRQQWFQWIHRLANLSSTSDQRNAAFYHILSLLVKVETIGPDASVHGSSVKEALDHGQEGGSGGKLMPEWQVEERGSLEDVVNHW